MEEQIITLLKNPPKLKQLITRKRRYGDEIETYALSGYDPITQLVFIHSEKYRTTHTAVEIDRFIFNEYSIASEAVQSPECVAFE